MFKKQHKTCQIMFLAQNDVNYMLTRPGASIFDECLEREGRVIDLVQHGNGKRNART